MKSNKTLLHNLNLHLLALGLIGSILVGLGEFFLHYSPQVLSNGEDFHLFKFVTPEHLKTGHYLAVSGLPFYFAGYIGIYKMLKMGNEKLAQIILALGFIAFAVGGIWIGSRAMIRNIVHLQNDMSITAYNHLLAVYKSHYEVLVQLLRIVIVLLSITFSIVVYKYKTMFAKWMAIANPIVILMAFAIFGLAVPFIGKFIVPILMNITHLVFFTLCIYNLNNYKKQNEIF